MNTKLGNLDASYPQGLKGGPIKPTLAAMPDELWRKIASYARPTTIRALMCVSTDASLRRVLRADTERTERTLFGMTRSEAKAFLDQVVDSRQYESSFLDESFTKTLSFTKAFKCVFTSCAKRRSFEFAQAFLAYGCDPKYAAYDGAVLHELDSLIYRGYFDVIPIAKLLVAGGADVRTTEPGLPPREDSRHTALDSAYATLDLLLNRWGPGDSPYGARHGLTHMSSRADLDHQAATACVNLILFLISATFEQMLPPGHRSEADCKAVMYQIRTQEAEFVRHRTNINEPGWSKTFYEVTASYMEFFDEKAAAGEEIPEGDEFTSRMLDLHTLTKALTRDDGPRILGVSA